RRGRRRPPPARAGSSASRRARHSGAAQRPGPARRSAGSPTPARAATGPRCRPRGGRSAQVIDFSPGGPLLSTRAREGPAGRVGAENEMTPTILMATDGSEAAAVAERYAASLAARLRARLQGISVVEDRLAKGFSEDGLGLAPPSTEAVAG